MPWWAWVAIVAPLACWLWRLSFRAALESESKIDGEAVAACVAAATIFFWLIGPGVLIYALARRLARGRDLEEVAWKIAGESREAKRRRREEALRERDARVREIERELGIVEE